MKKLISLIVIAFVVTVFTANAYSADDIKSVVQSIQNNYEKIDDFHANFIQEQTVRALDKTQTAKGEVWFKKPGKMRWNYYSPYKDEIVSDGKVLWFYNDEDKQVIESEIAEVKDTQSTTTLLSGLGNLGELFDASFAEPSDLDTNGNYLIDLKPKSEEEEYNKVTLSVDKKDKMVQSIFLYDPYGNLTKVTLEDVKINKGISDPLFTYKAKDGVEVIKAPKQAQQ